MLEKEKVVKTKICKHCKKEFYITDFDLELLEKISPIFNLETSLRKERPISESELIKDLWDWKVKYIIPTWNLCNECKEQRKLTFRNERNLYKRKCDFSWKEIVSIYSPDKQVKVYDKDIWWSDKWDALDFWIKFDFSKTFFEQFKEVFENVPKIAIFNKNCENSPYSHFESDQKNCYMTVWWHRSQDSGYMTYGIKSKNTYDIFWAFECENCYEIINSYNLNKCKYLEYSKNCFDCIFWLNLEWCQECIWCAWLSNKKYYILNKEYSKEEYLEKKQSINLTNKKNIENFSLEYEKIKLKVPHKDTNIFNSEDSVWNDIFWSKNIVNWFLIEDCENCKNISVAWWAKDTKDSYAFWALEKAYDVISWWLNSYNIAFMSLCYECNNSYYCIECHNSSNLFWCVWLRNKSYCILNKQYTKEEYNRLVPKIIENMQKTWEWWEFFPSSLSPFWYNETVANEYFPIEIKTGLSKKDIKYIDREWNTYKDLKEAWERPVFKYSTYESPKPKVEKIIPASKLPDDIKEIPDDILNRAIECEITKKPFRIIRKELEFYRKHNLPIPRRHPDQRHLDRMKLRNPRKLYDRLCDKCGKDIKTTYAPERPEIVYCEECYNKEMY